jgi:hypothetical protein
VPVCTQEADSAVEYNHFKTLVLNQITEARRLWLLHLVRLIMFRGIPLLKRRKHCLINATGTREYSCKFAT